MLLININKEYHKKQMILKLDKSSILKLHLKR